MKDRIKAGERRQTWSRIYRRAAGGGQVLPSCCAAPAKAHPGLVPRAEAGETPHSRHQPPAYGRLATDVLTVLTELAKCLPESLLARLQPATHKHEMTGLTQSCYKARHKALPPTAVGTLWMRRRRRRGRLPGRSPLVEAGRERPEPADGAGPGPGPSDGEGPGPEPSDGEGPGPEPVDAAGPGLDSPIAEGPGPALPGLDRPGGAGRGLESSDDAEPGPDSPDRPGPVPEPPGRAGTGWPSPTGADSEPEPPA